MSQVVHCRVVPILLVFQCLYFFSSAEAGTATRVFRRSRTVPCADVLQWSRDNAKWYDVFGTQDFEAQARNCGLASCVDLHQPRLSRLLGFPHRRDPRVPVPGTVVVLGAGYGRESSALVTDTRIPRIILFEHSKKYASVLRELFYIERQDQGGPSRVSVVEESILNMRYSNVVDVALWLWAGFFELAPQQKFLGLKKVYEALRPQGTLVIDVPIDITRGELRFQFAENYITVPAPAGGATLHLHLMNKEKIVRLARLAGFHLAAAENYFTTPPRSEKPKRRLLLYFMKPAWSQAK